MKTAISQLASFLSAPREGMSRDLLADIFSVALQPEETGDTEPGDTAGKPDRIQTRPQPVRITPLRGGFTIQGLDGAGQYVAEVAYRTRSGDPFRRYSPFDFAIGRNGVAFRSDGATVKVALV